LQGPACGDVPECVGAVQNVSWGNWREHVRSVWVSQCE
jgi:hypothetical protein